jgi:hypothetical protein
VNSKEYTFSILLFYECDETQSLGFLWPIFPAPGVTKHDYTGHTMIGRGKTVYSEEICPNSADNWYYSITINNFVADFYLALIYSYMCTFIKSNLL